MFLRKGSAEQRGVRSVEYRRYVRSGALWNQRRGGDGVLDASMVRTDRDADNPRSFHNDLYQP